MLVTTTSWLSPLSATAPGTARWRAAKGVQKPLLLWAIHAANQHGAVGRTEGAAAWQAGGGHRGAQSRAMHGLTHTSCKKCDYDPPHKHTWGQIPS